MEKIRNFISYLGRKSFILSGIFSFFAIVLGVLGIVFGAMGVCLICFVPFLTFVLGLFGLGIASLLDYNIYFIAAGFVFMGFSAYLYRRRSCGDGVCRVG